MFMVAFVKPQVDFNSTMRLKGISVQGSVEFNYWITEYYISYSEDDIFWQFYHQNTRSSMSFVNKLHLINKQLQRKMICD